MVTVLMVLLMLLGELELCLVDLLGMELSVARARAS